MRKYCWIIICVIILAILVFGSYLFVRTFVADKPIRTTDIIEYGERETNSLHYELLLFPETVSDENAEYYYFYQDVIFDPQAQIYLKCTYTEEEYEAELERMEPYYVEDSEHFDKPVFIQLYNVNSCYEYAIPDEENLTITYVYLQFMSKAKIKLDSGELPLDYKFP